jgi:hypothetical protein
VRVLASVLKEDVSWQTLPADLPVPIRRLLRRCLEKDPKRQVARETCMVNADGTGEVTRLTDSPDDERPASWHPSGKFLAFSANRAGTWDLMMLPMKGAAARGWTAGKPTVFLRTPVLEVVPMFSPHGRFIAYFSTEAGGTSFDVYVRPFQGPGSKWRVSTGTGAWPRWSAKTNELLFQSQSTQIWFAPFRVIGDAFLRDKPQL